jgi:hypothetical protein
MDYGNITNFAATCNLVLGIPKRKDGVVDLMGLPGSSWSTPMYSCISVTRASIKTVTFTLNTTDSLTGLTVDKIEPKTYANSSSMPIWAVENTTDTLNGMSPLWGLVSEDKIGTANLSTLRSEYLYLPGYSGLGELMGSAAQNLPAVEVPAAALSSAYHIGVLDSGEIDYSGLTNLAMWRRWQGLSSSPSTMGTIFNLVITDYLANALVGTKSRLQSTDANNLDKRDGDSSNHKQETFKVTENERMIKYRVPFAVPAIVLLALLLATILVSICAVTSGRTSASKMRRYLNATSAGRLMTRAGPADEDAKSISTMSWMDTDGKKQVSAGNGSLVEVDAEGVGEGGKLLKQGDANALETKEMDNKVTKVEPLSP